MSVFEPFTLPNGVVVDDWDNDRHGRLWVTSGFLCTADTHEAIRHGAQTLYDQLPAVNAQGVSREAIKWLHLSGNLQRPTSFAVTVFVAY